MTEYYNKTTDELNSEKFVNDLMSFLEHIYSKEKLVEVCCRELKNMGSFIDFVPFLMQTSKKQADFILPLELIIRTANQVAEAEIIIKRLGNDIESQKQIEMFKSIDLIQQKIITLNYQLLPYTSKNRRGKLLNEEIGDF